MNGQMNLGQREQEMGWLWGKGMSYNIQHRQYGLQQVSRLMTAVVGDGKMEWEQLNEGGGEMQIDGKVQRGRVGCERTDPVDWRDRSTLKAFQSGKIEIVWVTHLHTHAHRISPTAMISCNELCRHLSQFCSWVSFHWHILSILLSSGPSPLFLLTILPLFPTFPFSCLCSFHLLIKFLTHLLIILVSLFSTWFCQPFSPSCNNLPVEISLKGKA